MIEASIHHIILFFVSLTYHFNVYVSTVRVQSHHEKIGSMSEQLHTHVEQLHRDGQGLASFVGDTFQQVLCCSYLLSLM